jgi:surface antigen
MIKRLTAAALAASIAFCGLSTSAQADPYWQCVTFARMFSGIQIFGDAWTWWEKATGKYKTGATPEAGAVLVFRPSGHMRLGHVAVVSHVLTDRIIQISHANWSPIDGGRGKVEQDVTVVDVSPKGDWTKVKVWYNPMGDLGHTVYPTYGFIYQAAKDATTKLVGAPKPKSPAQH